uniref:Uncharacterized protein n=1 Tax=Anguilla anguilla TaxID=7936 RepID=A0A0E9VMK8_ANGAN
MPVPRCIYRGSLWSKMRRAFEVLKFQHGKINFKMAPKCLLHFSGALTCMVQTVQTVKEVCVCVCGGEARGNGVR